MEESKPVIEWPRTVRIHGGSLYISLPSDWIRSNSIKPGKNVKLQLLNDGRLVITRDGSQ